MGVPFRPAVARGPLLDPYSDNSGGYASRNSSTGFKHCSGLITTASAALGVPFIQGRIAVRNAAAGRLHEQRVAVYTDAVIFLQSVESRLQETLEDPDLRSRRERAEVPHQDLITARIRLLAPMPVVQSWQELVVAWDALAWNAQEEGPVNDRGDYHLNPENPDVLRVQATLHALTTALRQAMGVSAVG
jgi:hypothetical protein